MGFAGSTERLGAAITHLISLEMTLAFAQRRIAGAAIERAFAAGAADGSRVQLDVPGLVGIYRAVVADPSRRDVEELVLRLLAAADRAAVIDSIPIDAAGLDLRATLVRALDARPVSYPQTSIVRPKDTSVTQHWKSLGLPKGPVDAEGRAPRDDEDGARTTSWIAIAAPEPLLVGASTMPADGHEIDLGVEFFLRHAL